MGESTVTRGGVRWAAALLSATLIVLCVATPPAFAANAVLCGTPGKDGSTASFTGGVPNSYWQGSGSPAAGATSITLGTMNAAGNTTLLTAGDLILIYQSQGASITTTDSAAYGSGTNGTGYKALDGAGQYEYARVVSVSGSTVTIFGAGTGNGLVHAYTTASYAAVGGGTTGTVDWQVVRVPQFGNYTVGTNLYTAQWNGSSGGIVALDVAGALTLTNQINADGYGFRGGGQNPWGNGYGGTAATSTTTTGASGATDVNYRYAPTVAGLAYSTYQGGPEGFKGEGIAGTPSWVYASGASAPVYAPSTISSFANDGTSSGYPSGSKGRGAPANAGGGGSDADANGWDPYSNAASTAPNQYNSGGGGGANGGAGGLGGENWSGTQSTEADGKTTSQGIGGSALTPAIATLVAMGGGGGAGSNNDGSNGGNTVALGGGRTFTATAATASSGASGGGLVMLRVGTLGGGTISANGISAPDPDNDGGGGGGGGGTIVVTGTGTVTATATAVGGQGANSTGGNGDASNYDATQGQYPHGPGGGGGGGVVLNSGTGVTATVTGGNPGATAGYSGVSANANYDATAGGAGVHTASIATTSVAGVRSGAECSLLLLAKRYTTKISGGVTTTYTSFTSDGYTDPNSSTVVDTDPVWPQSGGNPVMPGAITVTNVPGDVLEYTIYGLSAGGKSLTTGVVCDYLPPDQSLVSTYSGATSMKLSVGYTSPTVSYFGTATTSGNTGVYPINTATGAASGVALPAACGTVPKDATSGKYSAAAIYYNAGTVASFITTNTGYFSIAFEGMTT